MGGSSTAGAAGVYGTQGIAAISNVPGARSGADSWVDTSGNLWLFGGGADGSIRGAGWNAVFNDLWKFNPASQEWTWMSGSNTPGNFAGVYQAQGVAATANVPSSRFGAVSWIDMSGNLWLFGGDCYASGEGVCNDLWEFNTTTKEWTWMSGSDATYAAGVYGTQGVASSSNVPGARYEAVSWTDNSGTFWLFGGIGLADYVPQYPPDGLLYLNDLWKFTPSTNKWTWVSGSTTGTASGVYGTLGVSSANNVPGGRAGAVSWADSSGNLWLFGGDGLGSTYVPVANSYLNDLWEFNTTTKEWTWVSGSDSTNASGVYGTEGVAAGSNTPASLSGAASWIDASGNLWLFGGWNYYVGPNVTFDDLWQFNTKTQQWTWMSGSGINTADTSGGYGTLGVPAVGNVPGARTGAVSWIDPRGNLWLFGGWGYDSTNTLGDLNDLWRYQP
jgi:hypothetical protein